MLVTWEDICISQHVLKYNYVMLGQHGRFEIEFVTMHIFDLFGMNDLIATLGICEIKYFYLLVNYDKLFLNAISELPDYPATKPYCIMPAPLFLAGYVKFSINII